MVKDLKNTIIQRSIGLRMKQLMFFDKYPELNKNEIIRETIDKLIIKTEGKGSEFLDEATN